MSYVTFTEFTVLKFEQDVYYVDEGISSEFLALHACVFVDTPVPFILTLTPVSITATGNKTNKEQRNSRGLVFYFNTDSVLMCKEF